MNWTQDMCDYFLSVVKSLDLEDRGLEDSQEYDDLFSNMDVLYFRLTREQQLRIGSQVSVFNAENRKLTLGYSTIVFDDRSYQRED